MRTTSVFAVAAVLFACTGCASPRAAGPQTCAAGLSRATTAELVFGRDIGGATTVSEGDWKVFLDQDVTPRFPDGLSVMDVQGQWRASNGQIVREPSKMLYLVLDGGPDDPAKIAAIREGYKRRFHQQSVLLIIRPACVSF